jgi:membrane protein
MPSSARAYWDLVKSTFKEWQDDKASRLAAALSYYALFSIGPLLLVAVSIVGFVYGRQAAEGQIVGQIQGVVGPQTAQTIQGLVASANKPTAGIVSTVIGIVTLLLGATGVFGQLQDALNTVWEVEPKPGRGIRAMVLDRGLTFLMVLGVAVVLLAMLIASALLQTLIQFFSNILPGQGVAAVLFQVANFALLFLVGTLSLAVLYKYLPDANIRWRDVLLGAAVTALLLAIGQFAISIYLGRSSVGSAYGAAGSLVVLLVWVYYSAQVFFFGAEFTKVYADAYGSRVVPQAGAQVVPETKRAEQGMAPKAGKTGDHASASESEQGAALPRRSPPAWYRRYSLAVLTGVLGLLVGGNFLGGPRR